MWRCRARQARRRSPYGSTLPSGARTRERPARSSISMAGAGLALTSPAMTASRTPWPPSRGGRGVRRLPPGPREPLPGRARGLLRGLPLDGRERRGTGHRPRADRGRRRQRRRQPLGRREPVGPRPGRADAELPVPARPAFDDRLDTLSMAELTDTPILKASDLPICGTSTWAARGVGVAPMSPPTPHRPAPRT
jgi:hypothetical protein